MKTLDEINQEWSDEIELKKALSPNPNQNQNQTKNEIEIGIKIESESEIESAVDYDDLVLKKTAGTPTILKDLLFLGLKIGAIAFIFIMLFTFLFGFMHYQEPYMSPAIKDGDLVIYFRYNKSGYLPKDAVVLEISGKKQVRRVIATAGDIVDITEDGLLINGALQNEPDISQKTERYEDGIDFPLTVPEGQIFVLGDSRIGATDSRVYGSVKIEDTLGKVMTVIRRRSF